MKWVEASAACRRSALNAVFGGTFETEEEMATNICENERCTYHRPMPVKEAGAPYVDTVEDGERVRVERHLYRSRNGEREFFLCDVCHAAVRMVAPPNLNYPTRTDG